jgi:hypothetical protein
MAVRLLCFGLNERFFAGLALQLIGVRLFVLIEAIRAQANIFFALARVPGFRTLTRLVAALANRFGPTACTPFFWGALSLLLQIAPLTIQGLLGF